MADDGDKQFKPSAWKGDPPGGHHRKGVLQFAPVPGHRILAQAPGLEEAAEMVLSHQERFDGSGYPRGLAGGDIPLGARLFAVIDTLDAMTSERPYRRALPFDAAAAEIDRMRGTQFDPLAVEAFFAETTTLTRMVALKCTLPQAFAGVNSDSERIR